ncbi:hypothetical protein LWP59_32595 [Amycolatopsis acidiphila]|uniref:Uncharacterized protein n=1 Tax=Amycolatopsis acidiphila TaxID=715473 RepID=A0A558AE95_9PSEU|nr:hypothetical protein [Amycolatopsis acidiphila]TVT22581.1 hypothetical protein FNH06_13265 [Amycolatopsis acidiphila]UIJ58781.1 hypothetical protein LWP59_32595 [Amycolatopsis acidiphila]GHG71924.1 hypothetical protein GCM10017788_34010 [Amycolatopsis acidiphila]
MAEPIMANYVQEDDDWAVTVAGPGKTLTGRAPGIIAARDSVDQLVDSLGADGKGATVVHLLNGSALEFTAAYMTARLTRPEAAPVEVPASAEASPEASEASAASEEAGSAAGSEAAGSTEAASAAGSEAAGSEAAAEVPAQQSEEQAGKPRNKASRRPKAKLTADIGDALETSVKQPKVSVAASQAAAPSARS